MRTYILLSICLFLADCASSKPLPPNCECGVSNSPVRYRTHLRSEEAREACATACAALELLSHIQDPLTPTIQPGAKDEAGPAIIKVSPKGSKRTMNSMGRKESKRTLSDTPTLHGSEAQPTLDSPSRQYLVQPNASHAFLGLPVKILFLLLAALVLVGGLFILRKSLRGRRRSTNKHVEMSPMIEEVLNIRIGPKDEIVYEDFYSHQ